jgi:hypothetical protein
MTAAETTITTTTSAGLYVNALLKVPRTGEILRVVSVVSTAEITVGRSWTTAAAAVISTDDTLVLIGNVNAEGAALLSANQQTPTRYTGYTQILRKPFMLTGTYEATRLYTGNPMQDEVVKALIQHKLDIESTFLFGEATVDTSTFTNVSRNTMGIIESITANNTNVAGALTEDAFEEIMRTGFQYNSMKRHKLLLVSSLLAKYINSFAREKIRIVKDTSSYGINVGRYQCAHGTVDIIVHDLLIEDYLGYGILIDVPLIKARPLAGNGKNRDTKLYTNVKQDGADATYSEYLTEIGFEIRGGATGYHSLITGVT